MDLDASRSSKQPEFETETKPLVAIAFPFSSPPDATTVAVTHFVVARAGPPVGCRWKYSESY